MWGGRFSKLTLGSQLVSVPDTKQGLPSAVITMRSTDLYGSGRSMRFLMRYKHAWRNRLVSPTTTIATTPCLRVMAMDSKRRAKDPGQYSNIEEIRRELEEAKGQVPFSLTKTIQWLGQAANNGGGSLAFRAYSWVLGLDQPSDWQRLRESPEEEQRKLKEIESRFDKDVLQQFEMVLLLPKTSVLKLVRRCPGLEQIQPQHLVERIIALKSIFPQCDVARMVELLPTQFLVNEPWKETYEQLQTTSTILREGLYVR